MSTQTMEILKLTTEHDPTMTPRLFEALDKFRTYLTTTKEKEDEKSADE